MYMTIKKGQMPPLAALQAATKDNREAYGCALIHDNEITVETGVLPWGDNTDEDIHAHLMKTAEDLKDGVVVFWFSDGVVKTDQPFTLFEAEVNGRNTIQAIVLCDGDFSNHDDDESDESAEYLAHVNFIKPRSEEIIGLPEVDGDIDKFKTYLTGNQNHLDNYVKDVLGGDKQTAGYTTLFSDGMSLNFGDNNAPCRDFPWGFMSNTHGYVEGKGTATVKPKGTKPTIDIKGQLDAAVGTVTLIDRHPPKALKAAKDLIGWYQTWNHAKDDKGKGIVPENHRERPPVSVDKAKWEADPNFRNVPAGTAATAVKPAGSVPNVKPGNAKPSIRPAEGVHSIKFNPILSAEQKAKLTTGWMNEGFINEATSATTTLGSREDKIPTFAETTGVSLNDLLRHDPTSLNFIVEKHPELATNLIVELLQLAERKKVLSPTAVTAAGGRPKINVKPAKAA